MYTLLAWFQRKQFRAGAALALLWACVFSPGGAQAHGGGVAEEFQTFTQSIGPYEIALTLDIPPYAPAPLYIDIVPPANIGEATITLRTVPRGQPAEQAQAVTVTTQAGADTIYYAELQLDRSGDWDLQVDVVGAAGTGQALIPYTVPITAMPTYSLPLYGAVGVLIVLMIVTIFSSMIFRQQRRAIPKWLSWGLGQSMFAALIVLAIFGILQFNESAKTAAAAGSAPATTGRPHANMALSTTPALPSANQSFELELRFSDGGTGQPIKDIVTHHDALLHLVVLNEAGSVFEHIHPAADGPGIFRMPLTLPAGGRYTAYAEIERIDSGTQVLRRDFEVFGPAAPAALEQGLGVQTFGDLHVNIAASAGEFIAGQQVTFTASFSDANGPVSTMQPWLGMAGHFLARSDDEAIFAHVHAAEPMAPYGRPITVQGTTYGPDIRFVYTFPQAGRYHIWMQFKYKGEIITTPLVVDVQP